jgi:hypothetical protein
MKKLDIFLIIILSIGFGLWADHSYDKALDSSYQDFRDRDYKLFTKADLPQKYHEDFISHQKTKGNIWVMDYKSNMPYLVRKNETF